MPNHKQQVISKKQTSDDFPCHFGSWRLSGVCCLGLVVLCRLSTVGCLLFVVSCRSAKPPPEPPLAVERAERATSQAVELLQHENWPAAAAEWKKAADAASLLNDRKGEAVALHNLAQAQRMLPD